MNEIRVKDTGIGMSEAFCKRIWEAYARENRDQIQAQQGTGLGMMIVKNIVNLMQGTIELKSELGKGSEFIIRLPFEKAAGTEQDTGENRAQNDALSKSYKGRTILVVDDSAMNLKLAERVLAKFDFHVITADSGVNALQILQEAKPGDIDMVLMDVMMPVMDGLEATRKIRSLPDEKLANIPVLAMTANAFASDVQDCLDAGMNSHIPKPFRKEELITKISAFLP